MKTTDQALSTATSTISNGTNPDEVIQAITRLRALPTGSGEWTELRAQIITSQTELARAIAHRFHRRGMEFDDLLQIAVIGMIKALDRFDVTRAVAFAQYAVPTMTGEIKRHFRDQGWAMHVHRSLKDLHLEVNRVESSLSQELQRTPSENDIASELRVQVDEVRAAIACTVAYQPRSLDAPSQHSPTGATLTEQIGGPDHELEMITDRVVLREALVALTPREKQLLQWRFVDGMTQAEIGRELNISQMHVSRLLSAAFVKLRQSMLAEEDTEQPAGDGSRISRRR